MTSSYLLTLKDLNDETMPTNFGAYAINWGECKAGYSTVAVNSLCNNNKICVPKIIEATGKPYGEGPAYFDTSKLTNPSYRRYTSNLYDTTNPGLCLPPFSQCVQRNKYLPASQSLFDRPAGPNREVNFRYEIGTSPNCTQSPSCQECSEDFQVSIQNSSANSTNDWDYLQANDYFNNATTKYDGTGYNNTSRQNWRINQIVPISQKWNAYRITKADTIYG